MRKRMMFLAAVAGLVAAVLKRQRDRELDEAVWEEPREPVAGPGTGP